MIARNLLLAAISLTTLGMIVVVIGVISPGVFYLGVYLIDAGVIALAAAGVLHLITRPKTT